MAQKKSATEGKGAETPKAPQNEHQTQKDIVSELGHKIVTAILPYVGAVIGAQWEIGKIIFDLFRPYDKALDASEKKAIYGMVEKETSYKESTLREFERVYGVFYRVFTSGKGASKKSSPEVSKPEYGRNWKSLAYLASEHNRLSKGNQGLELPVYAWASAAIEQGWGTSTLKDIVGIAVKDGLPLDRLDLAYDRYMKVEADLVEARRKKMEERERKASETKALLKAIREGKPLPIDNAPAPEGDASLPAINPDKVSAVLVKVLDIMGVSKPIIHNALAGDGAQALETVKSKVDVAVGTAKQLDAQTAVMSEMAHDLEQGKATRSMLRQALDHVLGVQGLDVGSLDDEEAVDLAWRTIVTEPALPVDLLTMAEVLASNNGPVTAV